MAQMSGMWVCIVGVVRPDIDRVVANVKTTMATIRASVPDARFVVVSYNDEDAPALQRAVAHLVDVFKLVEPAPIAVTQGRSYRDGAGGKTTTLRMLASVQAAVDEACARGAQWILRTRLDCALTRLGLPEAPLDERAYYVPRDRGGNMTDNIGFAHARVMAAVWHARNADLPGRDNEAVIDAAIKQSGAWTNPGLKFELRLYQTKEKHFKGVAQWSRRDRVFQTNKTGSFFCCAEARPPDFEFF